MKAMIFAAGEGRRMRPLSLTKPKPLLEVRGRPLIEHHLLKLRDAGVSEVVINVAYLSEQIEAAVGDGRRFGLSIRYSREAEPLETGGGLRRALPLLGAGVFTLISADVWTDFPLARLRAVDAPAGGAHLVLVPTPPFKASGDFSLDDTGVITSLGGAWTYSGIALVHPELIYAYPDARERFPLVEALAWALAQGRLRGEVYRGDWQDVGTPERLAALNCAQQV